MKYLITGGAGFIGYHLSTYLADRGDEVLIIDNMKREDIGDDISKILSHDNIRFMERDLSEKSSLSDIERVDFVYHLAALNGTEHFYNQPGEVARSNILPLMNVLDWFKETNSGKMVFTSSSEVYSNVPSVDIPTSEDVMTGVKDLHNPRFSYGASKILGEVLCNSYHEVHGCDVNIVRPHNIYGPRMGTKHVIPDFMKRIVNEKDPFPIYGKDNTRSFCYITDFIEGIISVAENADPGITYNIGREDEITMEELARLMFDLFDHQPELEVHNAPEGSTSRRCPDISRIKEDLNYSPTVDLEEGLIETFEWYKKRFNDTI